MGDKKQSDKYEYDAPQLDQQAQELLQGLQQLNTGNTSLEEKTKYTVALELFKLKLLPLITELDKEHVQILTRHSTWIDSASLLFGIEKDSEVFQLLDNMSFNYRLNMVSFRRKSRTEIVNILRNETSEVLRTTKEKLVGAK